MDRDIFRRICRGVICAAIAAPVAAFTVMMLLDLTLASAGLASADLLEEARIFKMGIGMLIGALAALVAFAAGME